MPLEGMMLFSDFIKCRPLMLRLSVCPFWCAVPILFYWTKHKGTNRRASCKFKLDISEIIRSFYRRITGGILLLLLMSLLMQQLLLLLSPLSIATAVAIISATPYTGSSFILICVDARAINIAITITFAATTSAQHYGGRTGQRSTRATALRRCRKFNDLNHLGIIGFVTLQYRPRTRA